MLKVTIQCTALCCVLVVYKCVKHYFLSSNQPKMSLGILKSPTGSFQTIQFSESEENNSFPITCEDVKVISSSGAHVTGSSKVKMNNIVDYSWEERYYTGQLLAVHRDGKYIAYGIKGAQSNSVIRVVNRESSKRALIKGVEGMIEDLAFAFIPNQVILASLDQFGNVLIHKIQENTAEILCALILQIKGETFESEGPKRIFWCPYVPDEEAENVDDPYAEGLLLAVTRGTKIQMWSVSTLAMDAAGTSYSGGNPPGFLSIDAHSDIIVDAAFSPDGSAIATASHDGKCKFFQAYMHGEGRCLHEWEPHDGEPVTLLFFLDNYTVFDHDTQFWKYAVTGAQDNCELKLWSCETWECIQTIKFTSSNNLSTAAKKLKAAIDLTAGYILLSDMYYRLLYVLELQKNGNETLPFVRSISEFKLPYPILSFGIVDAGPKTFKPNTSFTLEDLCNGEGEEESQVAVMVRMYLVQPKSLQECHIVFQSVANNNATLPPKLLSLSQQGSLAKQERLNDISSGLQDLDLSTNHNHPQPPPPPLNLMTPDAFHSPSNKDSIALMGGDSKATPLPDSSDSYTTSNTALVNNSEASTVGVGFVSGGSSPSREVQEILSSPCYYVSPRSPQPQQHVITSQSPNITCLPEVSNKKFREIESNINSLKGDMTTLMQALQNLSSDIQILREELRLTKSNNENIVLKAISDGSLKCNLDQDELSSNLIKEVQATVLTNLMPQVTMEFKNIIKQDVNKMLNELKDLIHTELTQRLTMTDQALKENLSKLVRSKSMMELLTNSLTGAASVSMEQLYKETFIKAAVPLFENACTNMFKQVNEALTQGLQEYVKEAELYSTKSNERTNMELMTVQSATEHLTLTAQQFSSVVDKETKRLNDMVQEFQRSVVASANLNNGSMRSGTVTPAFTDPHLLQSQLSKMISQGQIDAAFQQALSASDLSLVMYVCENVPPHKVFTDDGCLLQQHVLLSLIQQLSADMSQHTDIKHKYLEEAVMNLDSNNSNTREHMPVVLRGLHKQLKVFLSANPNSRLTKNVRMLQMATQSLLSP